MEEIEMSMMHCFECDREIDTDYDTEHEYSCPQENFWEGDEESIKEEISKSQESKDGARRNLLDGLKSLLILIKQSLVVIKGSEDNYQKIFTSLQQMEVTQ